MDNGSLNCLFLLVALVWHLYVSLLWAKYETKRNWIAWLLLWVMYTTYWYITKYPKYRAIEKERLEADKEAQKAQQALATDFYGTKPESNDSAKPQ